jgi:hypothetical protein
LSPINIINIDIDSFINNIVKYIDDEILLLKNKFKFHNLKYQEIDRAYNMIMKELSKLKIELLKTELQGVLNGTKKSLSNISFIDITKYIKDINIKKVSTEIEYNNILEQIDYLDAEIEIESH